VQCIACAVAHLQDAISRVPVCYMILSYFVAAHNCVWMYSISKELPLPYIHMYIL
jgi:hypothetical protein